VDDRTVIFKSKKAEPFLTLPRIVHDIEFDQLLLTLVFKISKTIVLEMQAFQLMVEDLLGEVIHHHP
jgi:hypothetical protein